MFCDLAAALLATVVGLSIVWIASSLGAFSKDYYELAAIYCLTIPFTAYSSLKGLLQLYGRFDYITIARLGVAVITLFISILLWYYQAKFHMYVYVYSFISVVNFGIIITLSLAAWKANNPKPFLSFGSIFVVNSKSFSKEFLKFSWSTNALSTVNVLRQHMDIFLLGYLLGPSATGLYKVANQAASLISRFGDPLQHVIFPEIASLASKKEFGKLRKIIILSFIFGIILLAIFPAVAYLFGDIVISGLGGGLYTSASSAFLWLVFSHSLSVAGFHLRPCVVSFISPTVYLKNSIVAMIVFIPSLYICVANFQAVGAGIAQSIFMFVWFFLNSVVIFKNISFEFKDFCEVKNLLLSILIKGR
jgi:O-antigen/teichoic acid export membrane protein